MARVSGPLFSMSASGSVGKAITFASWKGRQYCREWFIPQNPKTTTQVNVRSAFSLLVAYWQTLTGTQQDDWQVLADPVRKSGFNVFMTHGMNEYMSQLGSSTTPTSVSYTGTPPAEVWTWA